MKTNKIDNASFGTKSLIGDISANNGLRKYSAKLTYGILDAFKKLNANGVNDELVFNLGRKIGAKKDTTDAIEIFLWVKDSNSSDFHPKSSISFSPKTLEKMSPKNISQLIQDTYVKLTKSNHVLRTNIAGYPSRSSAPISGFHQQKLQELMTSFGFNDWTCA